MDSGIFVNEAFTYALSEYLRNKKNPEGIKYNSFFVVVVRLLTMIYDELDILNPFYLNNENSLDTNLKKYGFATENIIEFKKTLQRFYENEGENNFIKLQNSDLIDRKTKIISFNKEDLKNPYELFSKKGLFVETGLSTRTFLYILGDIINYYISEDDKYLDLAEKIEFKIK